MGPTELKKTCYRNGVELVKKMDIFKEVTPCPKSIVQNNF